MRNKSLKLLSSLIMIAPVGVVFLPGCSSSNIVVGNFESYMSQDLMDEMKKEFGCQFLYYDTNETVETKFERNYDIAMPSSYEAMILKKKGQLSKIDWAAFNMVADDGTKEGKPVKNAQDAKLLFSDTIKDVINAQDDLYQGMGYLTKDESVLDYGIPYFLQSWMFAYKGCPAIDNLEKEGITWNDVAKEVGNNNYFKPTTSAEIACIDDVRTFYGMSKMTYDQINEVAEIDWNINPTTADQSVAQYQKEYDSFVKNFSSRSFYFNSDSNQVLLSLADPNGVNGAFCYNGDALYALTGGGIDRWKDLWTDADDNFHAVMPRETVITIDMLVFNKKNDNNPTRKQKVYDIAKKITLEGGSKDDDIAAVDEDDNYINGPMINFDFVMYTAPLKNLNDYVLADDGNIVENYEDKQQLFRKMYDIKVPSNPDLAKHLFEQPLSDLDKSNMHWAYEPEKEKL